MPDPDMRRLVSKTGAVAAYIGVAATALGTLGVDTSALVAGLSVGGITIGFAARDLASNYIAGIMLVASKPFRSGDRITVGREADMIAGIVSRIDLRYVHLRPTDPQDTSELLVPNSTVFSSVIRTYNQPQEDEFAILDSRFPRGFLQRSITGLSAAGSTSSKATATASATSSSAAASAASQQPQGTGAPEQPGSSESSASALAHRNPYTAQLKHMPEFVTLVDTAFRELSALAEAQLRVKYASILRDIPDDNCQKIVMWLASTKQLSNSQREEWRAFVAANNNTVPSWVPSAFTGTAGADSS